MQTVQRNIRGSLARQSVGFIIFVMLVLVAFVALGCAAQNVRNSILIPQMQSSWPEIRTDAEDGITAKVVDGRMSPARGESRRESLRVFTESMERLTPAPTSP